MTMADLSNAERIRVPEDLLAASRQQIAEPVSQRLDIDWREPDKQGGHQGVHSALAHESG